MQATPNAALLKKSDVCERLQISSRTLEGMVKDNMFPPPVRVGRYVYWTDKVITNWVKRRFGAQEAWGP